MDQDYHKIDLKVTVFLLILCLTNVRSCKNSVFRPWIQLFDEDCAAVNNNWHWSVLSEN